MYRTVIYETPEPTTKSTCVYVAPYESSVSNYYPYHVVIESDGKKDVAPYESSVSTYYPSRIVIERDGKNDVLRSETNAIRRELKQIKSDIGELKRRRESPSYYMLQPIGPNNTCPICASSSSNNQQSQNSIYYCDRCHGFVEDRAYSLQPSVTTKAPTTTYQDSYRRAPPSPPPLGYLCSPIYMERQRKWNELRKDYSSSAPPVKHPRHWIPTASKNSYPNRRWNLSEPHPEP